MTNKDIILKAIKFIEGNLKSELSVLDCSNHVHYSLYHFIRLFQNVTGFSPKSYIQQRRLSESVKSLMNKDKRIIDIAFDYQFGSHEAYTRAFRRQFNLSPTDIRNGCTITPFPLVKAINDDYIFQSDKARNEPPKIVNFSSKWLAGFSIFVLDDSKGTEVTETWNKFMSEVHTIANRVIPERYYQVQFWSDKQELGGLYFFIGLEVKNTFNTPPNFVIKELPETKYLRFIHKGLSNKVGYTYKYIYNQYLPETDYKLNKPYNFEFYGERYRGPYNQESESEIYIPVE